MSRVLDIPAEAVLPGVGAILAAQGVPDEAAGEGAARDVAAAARDALGERLAARAVLKEIDAPDFAAVFAGDGANAPDAPLAGIFPRAERLVLFAATCGPAVVARIRELFAARDYALGTALDAAASLAADAAAGRVADAVVAGCGPGGAALPYSPGYCGWDIGGQRALFAALRPETIGITLGESCVMDPLKSVSGVVVAGPPRIHVFADDRSCCAGCADRDCRPRVRAMTTLDEEGPPDGSA